MYMFGTAKISEYFVVYPETSPVGLPSIMTTEQKFSAAVKVIKNLPKNGSFFYCNFEFIFYSLMVVRLFTQNILILKQVKWGHDPVTVTGSCEFTYTGDSHL